MVFQGSPQLKPLDQRLHRDAVKVLLEDARSGLPDDVARHVFGASQLAFVFQLKLPGQGSQAGIDIGRAGDRQLLALSEGPALSVGDYVFQAGDGHPLADAASFVDLFLFPGFKRDGLNEFADKMGVPSGGERPSALDPGFLRGNGDSVFERCGIVRADF